MNTDVASIIMAAGRGSRMTGYTGNKTLLPLLPEGSAFNGRDPILLHLMAQLPAGPKALVVHHCQASVREATRHLEVAYCVQPTLNGTGGAILAAQTFIDSFKGHQCLITMGDVPFVGQQTYRRLVNALHGHDLVVLGFAPADKKQYGLLEIENGQIQRITEWKYWRDYPDHRLKNLSICNSGIYSVSRQALQRYLPVLKSRPQVVHKEINGQRSPIEEFFITDLIEFMVADGRPVGYVVCEDETETMGVDDRASLERAQLRFKALMQAD